MYKPQGSLYAQAQEEHLLRLPYAKTWRRKGKQLNLVKWFSTSPLYSKKLSGRAHTSYQVVDLFIDARSKRGCHIDVTLDASHHRYSALEQSDCLFAQSIRLNLPLTL